jgi:hypothetical protein
MQPQPPKSSHGNEFIAAPSPGYSSQTGIEYPQSPVPQQNQPYSPAPGTAAYQSNTPYQSYGTPAPAYTNSPQFSTVSPIASTPGGYGNQGGYANANNLGADPYQTKEGYAVSNVSVNTHTTGVTGTSGVSGISHTPYSQTQGGTAFELPATKEDTAYEMPAHSDRKWFSSNGRSHGRGSFKRLYDILSAYMSGKFNVKWWSILFSQEDISFFSSLFNATRAKC